MKKIAVGLLFLIAATSIFAEYGIPTPVVNLNVTNVLILLLSFVTLISILKRGGVSRQFASLSFLCLSIVGFGAISFEVQYAPAHFRTVITLSKGLILVLLITYWLDHHEEVKTVAKGLFIAGVLAFVGSALQGYFGVGSQFFAGTQSAGSRLPGLGLNLGIVRSPGFVEGFGLFGIYIESAALLAAMGFLSEGRKQGISRSAAWGGVLLAVCGLLLSQSRSGLLATAVGYVVFYLLSIRVYRRFTFVNAFPIAVLFIGLLFSGGYVWERLSSLNTLAIEYRLIGYQAAIKNILERPIFGISFSGIQSRLNYYHTIHSSYLNLALSGGVVSLFLYSYLKCKAALGGWRLLHLYDQKAPLAISLLSVLAATIVECALWGGGVFATVVYLIIGLLISLGKTTPVSA
jgi:hypothetical protein